MILANHSVNRSAVAEQENSYYYLPAPTGYSLLCDWRLAATDFSVGVLFWDKNMKRKTPEDYEELAKICGVKWLGPQVNNTETKTQWQCSKGHRWMTSYENIKGGSGCHVCARSKRSKSEQDYKTIAAKMGLVWLGQYVVSTSTKTLWQCSEGHEWLALYYNIERGHGCPYCKNRVPKTESDYYKLAEEKGYIWLGPYVPKVTIKTGWLCPRGHKWLARYMNILQGSGCPVCCLSRGEREVAGLLNKYLIKYEVQKKFDGCKNINHLPFDFYFYLGTTHFLVEYDGEQHFYPANKWEGIDGLKKNQNNDAIKTKFAQDNGFVLIRISYTVKSIKTYLQFELEKYLSFPLDQLKNQPQRPQPKIKPINPYQWQQGVLL